MSWLKRVRKALGTDTDTEYASEPGGFEKAEGRSKEAGYRSQAARPASTGASRAGEVLGKGGVEVASGVGNYSADYAGTHANAGADSGLAFGKFGKEAPGQAQDFGDYLTRSTVASTVSEYAAKTAKTDMEFMGGVAVEPLPITAGGEIKAKYRGLLHKNGAQEIYMHAGYGHRDWHGIQDIKMTKAPDGSWSATVNLDPEETSRFNFCFRDSAFNWDNNKGLNWSIEIHNGEKV